MKGALIPFQINQVRRMDNIRFILIVSFATTLLLLWQAWQQDYGPKPIATAVTQQPAVNNKADLPINAETTANADPSVPQTAIQTQTSSKVVTVKTDVLALEINTEGGTIQNLDLLSYPIEQDNTYVNWIRGLLGMATAEKNKSPVRLLQSDKKKLFVAQSGLIAAQGFAGVANHQTVYNFTQDRYELGAEQDSVTVPFTWTDSQGLVVTKTFTFKRGSYEITVDQKLKNDSGKDWAGYQYSQLLKMPDTENKGSMLTGGMRAYDGGVVYTEAEKYQKISFDDMQDEVLNVKAKGGWSAMIQHYFAAAWIPPADQENQFFTKFLQDGRFIIGASSLPTTVINNSETQFTTRLFAGPKIQPMMEKIAPGLELTVDYSVLTFIGKPIYSLLNLIHNLVGNWGWAIIGVTLCIKLLFFPLSQSSFKSMAKMRKIQPRLKELQERFASDRQRFNVEMMALYKKEKVNPLGGCLPLLIQIPVFMALYWVLSETVEFRHSPFMLWIQDLSTQDPFFILPVIMGITMKIQQSLNPAPIDPIQAKVMKMFPIVFTVFFLFFPAGLVLYWVINNTLSILQQSYITKQINKEA
jgi:YidC/Oxa1 family membrane protein insertase